MHADLLRYFSSSYSAWITMALSGEKASYALMIIALLLLVAIITSTYLDIKPVRQSGTI